MFVDPTRRVGATALLRNDGADDSVDDRRAGAEPVRIDTREFADATVVDEPKGMLAAMVDRLTVEFDDGPVVAMA